MQDSQSHIDTLTEPFSWSCLGWTLSETAWYYLYHSKDQPWSVHANLGTL